MTISDHAAASYSEGVILSALGRYEEAIESYDEAIRIKPDYFDAWRNSTSLKSKREE